MKEWCVIKDKLLRVKSSKSPEKDLVDTKKIIDNPITKALLEDNLVMDNSQVEDSKLLEIETVEAGGISCQRPIQRR